MMPFFVGHRLVVAALRQQRLVARQLVLFVLLEVAGRPARPPAMGR